MTQAIVTGAFMRPQDCQLLVDGERQPAPNVLRPAKEGDEPVVVELDSKSFRRQFALGNVESVEAHKIKAEAAEQQKKLHQEAERAAAMAREAALKSNERRGIEEDLERLAEMDKAELSDLALSRKLKVNTRRNEDNLRRDIANALQAELDQLD